MKAKDDFFISIDEISFLRNAVVGDSNTDKIYFKVIVLLLCAKLEKYVKDSTSEYIKQLLELNLTKKDLSNKFIIELIKNELEKINSVSVEKYIEKEAYKKRAKIFSLIWNDKYKLTDIEDDMSISISNNGTTALKDIYKKIGFTDIFSFIKDYEHQQTIDEIVTTTNHSVSNTIDKVVHMRHNIIHEDATPQITQKDIDLYVAVFKNFVQQMDNFLFEKIESLKKSASN